MTDQGVVRLLFFATGMQWFQVWLHSSMLRELKMLVARPYSQRFWFNWHGTLFSKALQVTLMHELKALNHCSDDFSSFYMSFLESVFYSIYILLNGTEQDSKIINNQRKRKEDVRESLNWSYLCHSKSDHSVCEWPKLFLSCLLPFDGLTSEHFIVFSSFKKWWMKSLFYCLID